jgi:hypothetical protein
MSYFAPWRSTLIALINYFEGAITLLDYFAYCMRFVLWINFKDGDGFELLSCYILHTWYRFCCPELFWLTSVHFKCQYYVSYSNFTENVDLLKKVTNEEKWLRLSNIVLFWRKTAKTSKLAHYKMFPNFFFIMYFSLPKSIPPRPLGGTRVRRQ